MNHLLNTVMINYPFTINPLESAEVPQDAATSINPPAFFLSTDPVRSADAEVFESLLKLTQSVQYPNVYTQFLIDSLESNNCSVEALCTEFLPSDPTFQCDAEGRLTAIEFDGKFKFQHLDLLMIPNSVQSLRFEDMSHMTLRTLSAWSDLEGKSLTHLSFGRIYSFLNVDLSVFVNPDCNLPLRHLTLQKAQAVRYFEGGWNGVLIDKIRNWLCRSSLESLEVLSMFRHQALYNFNRDGRVFIVKGYERNIIRDKHQDTVQIDGANVVLQGRVPIISTQGKGGTASTDSSAPPSSPIYSKKQPKSPQLSTLDLRGVAMDHLDLRIIPNSVTSLQLGRNNLKAISEWADLEGKSLEHLSFFEGEEERNGNVALRLNLAALTNRKFIIPLKRLEVRRAHIRDSFREKHWSKHIRAWMIRSTLEELRVIVSGNKMYIFYENGDFQLQRSSARTLDHVISTPLTQRDIDSTPPPLILTQSVADEAAAPLPILEVWNWNFDDAMRKMLGLVAEYPIIAIDTEFPGKIFQIGIGFDLMRRNVNALKLIQLGFTFFDRNGNSPTPHSTFQFNFQFDVRFDLFNQDSLQFLQENSGIDFARLSRYGIRQTLFAQKLKMSNLVRNPNLRWLCFHGIYDFGYLIKTLFGNLPETESKFVKSYHREFPFILDLKVLRLNFIEVSHCEGLQHLADELGVVRVGQAHQAGSDAHLTGKVFFALGKKHMEQQRATNGHGLDGKTLYELGKYPCPDRECGW